MEIWLPIDNYPKNLWAPMIVRLRDENGQEEVGSWGCDDESYDPESGEEFVYGAWHKHDDVNQPLGFEPIMWMPCHYHDRTARERVG